MLAQKRLAQEIRRCNTSRQKRPTKFVHNSRRSLFHTRRVLARAQHVEKSRLHNFDSSLGFMHKRLGVIS
jgi:hypothetical protein